MIPGIFRGRVHRLTQRSSPVDAEKESSPFLVRLRPIDGSRLSEAERVRELSAEVDGFRTGQARHTNANAELAPEARASGDIEHRRATALAIDRFVTASFAVLAWVVVQYLLRFL